MILGGAAAAPAANLDALLARVRDSLSPSADVGAVRALRVETVVEMEGAPAGRVETLGRREPRALLEVLDLAGVRRAVTVLDDRVWITDANGAVREATGEERVDALVAHSLLFHGYLAGSGNGLAVMPGPESSVELRAAGDGDAPARTLTFVAAGDPARLLPASFRQRQHGVEVVTTFGDWRETQGIRFPYVARQSTGDPRFDLTLRTAAVDVLDDLPEGAIAPPVEAARDFEITDPDSATAIAGELAGSLLLVTAEADGVRGAFLVDTGAGATVLDAAFAEELGLAGRGRMEARGAGGSEAAFFVDLETLRLPGVVVRGQTVVALPLEGVAAALGRPLAGILGYDFLSRFAVEIDWPAARLALRPPGAYRPPAGAVHVPLRIEAAVPRVEGSVEGHRGSFLVDTGNGRGLLLHTPFVRARGFDGRPSRPAADVTGVGGRTPLRSITVATLALGDAEFRDVTAHWSEENDGIVAIHESIGNVGAALFRDGVLAFDYSEESLWVRSPSAVSASAR